MENGKAQKLSLKQQLIAAIPLFFVMLTAALVVLMHVKEEFAGGKVSSDLFLFLNLASRISEGNGFIYNHLFTPSVWQQGLQLVPISPGRLMHPLLISMVELFTKDFLLAAVYISSMSHLLISMFVFLLARAWYGTKTAIIASILFILNRWAVGYTIWGQSDTPFVVFLTGTFWVSYVARNWKHYLVAGTLFGLAAITRPIGPTYLPPILLFLYLKDYKTPRKALVNIVLFSVCAFVPKMFLKYINIFYFGHAGLYENTKSITAARLLFYTKFFPKLTSIRHLDYPQSIYSMILTNPHVRASFITKVLANLSDVPATLNAFIFDNLWVGRASLLGLLWWEKDKKRNFLKLAVLIMLVSQILVLCMTVYKYRYFYPLLPFGCVLAAAFVIRFADFVIRFKGKLKYLKALIIVPALYFMLFPIPVLHTYEPAPKRFTRRLSKRPKSNALLVQYCQKLDEQLPEGMPFLCDFFAHVADTYMQGKHIIGLYPRTLTMLEKLHREKTDIDAVLLTPSYIRPDREFMEWMNLYMYPEAFLGFQAYEVNIGTFRTVLYKRDAEKQLGQIEQQIQKTPQLGQRLALAGLARIIRPRNTELADNLEKLRAKGTQKARELAKNITEGTDIQTSFALLKQAGATADGIGLCVISKTAKDLENQQGLYRNRFTNNPDYELRPTTGGIPAPQTLTDGDLLERFPAISLDSNYDFDLKTTRYVDEVIIKTDFDPQTEYFDSIEVSTSIDGFNWQKVKQLNIAPTDKGFYLLRIKDIDRFCRHVRISIKGDGVRFIKILELEIWGYTDIKPQTHISKRPAFKPIGPFYAHTSARHTGTVVADGNGAKRPNVLAKAQTDKKGLIFFGNYVFLRPGEYKSIIKLKTANVANPELAVATIDVAADHGRNILASKEVTLSNMPAPGKDGFSEFALDFVCTKPGKVEPRIYFHANSDLYCRNIVIDGMEKQPVYTNTGKGKMAQVLMQVD